MGVDWKQIEEDLNTLKTIPWKAWKKIYEEKAFLTMVAISGILGHWKAKDVIEQGLAKDTLIAEIFLTAIFGIFFLFGVAVIFKAIFDIVDRYTT
jgi:hypothetical protein